MNEGISLNKDEEEIRAKLTSEGQQAFDDIYYGRLLGASNNIKSIALILASTTDYFEREKQTTEALINQIKLISSYYKAKRGESSYAILVAIEALTKEVNCDTKTISEVRDRLRDNYTSYLEDATLRMNRVKEYLRNIVKELDSVLLFDYSGTVNLLMEVAKEENKVLDVYVPESRILDGGQRFLKNGIQLGHRMHYVPDASLSFFIKRCDASFIGAETVYADGTVLNTLGSDEVGILSTYYKKPLYVPLTLSKLNPKGLEGIQKKENIEDGSGYFGLHLDEEVRKEISIDVPGLVKVNPSDITAFITEYGVIPPSGMYSLALEYLKETKNDN